MMLEPEEWYHPYWGRRNHRYEFSYTTHRILLDSREFLINNRRLLPDTGGMAIFEALKIDFMIGLMP